VKARRAPFTLAIDRGTCGLKSPGSCTSVRLSIAITTQKGGFVAGGRLTISHKFVAVLAVLAPLIVAVAVAGVVGLGSMKHEFDGVFADNIHTSQVSTSLGAQLARADDIALRLAAPTDPGERASLFRTLDQSVVPAVDTGLSELQALHAHDPLSEREKVERLDDGWSEFLTLRDQGAFNKSRPTFAGPNGSDALTDHLAAIFDPFRTIIQSEANLEATQAGQSYTHAVQTYDTSRMVIWSIAILACLLGIGAMLLLTRNVVPRIKRYSRFASSVATGDLSVRLNSRGSDELATLGRTLDEMVARREFVDTLQVIETEDGGRDLLRRQVQRSVPGASVVILNRNNSDDRLEAATPLEEASPLHQTLAGATPRSCMAVLFARAHTEDPDGDPLTRCQVCGMTGRKTRCEPLLAGGEVIGSLLLEHDAPLEEQQTEAIRDSVSQAAPVLANLRNLALAEYRASTDSLTGLPNQRAVKDTVKRMAAQAARASTPLSAIMFDLDHFKQVNDTFGHGRGDDVLAAVGAVLTDAVRASDFAGRSGGEEFTVLLPDTDTDAAQSVAEKIRAMIAKISVDGVDRSITASLGLASIPEHAGGGDQLVRSADRALYAAKSNGRNRVETASLNSSNAVTPEPVIA
jgi:diguanylate cyclase (GGDEF)-like protein